MRKTISTDKAPKAIGPYSQAVIHGGIAYLSGQIAIDPATNVLVEGGVEEQAVQVLENMKAVLEACGSSLAQVLKTTIFLKDIGDFAKVNEIYGRYFGSEPPARSTVEAARLPRDVRVEIDAICAIDE
jgi:2-iminobutanoate/2-iminopropanoate deaminase